MEHSDAGPRSDATRAEKEKEQSIPCIVFIVQYLYEYIGTFAYGIVSTKNLLSHISSRTLTLMLNETFF